MGTSPSHSALHRKVTSDCSEEKVREVRQERSSRQERMSALEQTSREQLRKHLPSPLTLHWGWTSNHHWAWGGCCNLLPLC